MYFSVSINNDTLCSDFMRHLIGLGYSNSLHPQMVSQITQWLSLLYTIIYVRCHRLTLYTFLVILTLLN